MSGYASSWIKMKITKSRACAHVCVCARVRSIMPIMSIVFMLESEREEERERQGRYCLQGVTTPLGS